MLYSLPSNPSNLFVSIEQAQSLNNLTFLDARDRREYSDEHLPGAQSAPWQDFVNGSLETIQLKPTDQLESILQALGIRNQHPVVIYGNWKNGWGEEGRMYWLLDYLGHRYVYILRGGIQAWKANGLAVTHTSSRIATGNFSATPNEEWRATWQEILNEKQTQNGIILDSRTSHEYQGAILYNEKRGGHIPNAHHFWWKRVFNNDGTLVSKQTIRSMLRSLGATQHTPIYLYCTGGIRSGFLYAALRWAGFTRVANYDRSFWEWAALHHLPLE